MKLHLLRHGKAQQSSDSGRDFDRGLSEKGQAQCKLVREHFLKNNLAANVWCSSAKRTRETFGLVRKSNEFSSVKMMEDLYLCSRTHFLDALWQLNGSEDLLIVGHNFGISELATYLSDIRIELRTAGYVCLEFEDLNWNEVSRGTGTIVDQYRPHVSL